MTHGLPGWGTARRAPYSAFDEAFFDDFFIREPEVGDVGGAEAEDVFEGAADFAEMEIHADALEQFNKVLRSHGLDGLGADAVVLQPVIGHNINGLGTASMAIDVEETAGGRLNWGKPCRYP